MLLTLLLISFFFQKITEEHKETDAASLNEVELKITHAMNRKEPFLQQKEQVICQFS